MSNDLDFCKCKSPHIAVNGLLFNNMNAPEPGRESINNMYSYGLHILVTATPKIKSTIKICILKRSNRAYKT